MLNIYNENQFVNSIFLIQLQGAEEEGIKHFTALFVTISGRFYV